jgi:hypothetical protein
MSAAIELDRKPRDRDRLRQGTIEVRPFCGQLTSGDPLSAQAGPMVLVDKTITVCQSNSRDDSNY